MAVLIAAASQAGATPAAGGRELTAVDAEAFVDGLMPYALKRGDVAGAVVVVVKDGEVLLAKGYGYADVAKQTPVDPSR
ncbi:serine hydrolase, partial [Puniceibacterium confluentis]|uniref:serine hydrolase n=1 Tax=Puniceibacterium confluentis TaxID=1958944 RepID=UPI001C97936E